MAVGTREVAALTGDLIETLTGFKPDEENYDLCFQFCKSNFKFHRFLDINSNNVTRSIENVVTKFQVHTLPERSHQLSVSTKHFLSLGLYPNSDIHYKVLHFLMETSISPTNASYNLPEHLEPLVVKKQRDTFNWEAYLMEGIEIPSFSDTTSEEMSTLSGVDSSSEDDDKNDSAFIEDLSDELVPANEKKKYSQSICWLADHVTSVYWEPHSVHNSLDNCKLAGHPSCNFLSDSGGKAAIIVTELQVVRETLWMLMGAVGGCVYDNDTLEVNREVGMTHTSLLSFYKAANEFSKVGQQLKTIRNNIMTIIDPKTKRTQVVEGSMHFIMNYVNRVNGYLRNIEKDISTNKRFVSLLTLMKELNHLKKEVISVCSVLESCNEQNSILDVLWTHLDFHNTMNDSNSVNIMLPWLLATIRPYMEIMNKWLTEGELEDPHNEFFVKRNVAESRSWRNGFTVEDNQPLCFKPLFDKILVAGKSWCYIESFRKKKLIDNSIPSLYNDFMKRLFSSENETNPTNNKRSLAPKYPSHHSDQTDPPYLVMSGIDPVLCSSLLKLSANKYSIVECSSVIESNYGYKLDYCTPITQTISNTIQHCVHSRYTQATSSLTSILKTDYKLLEHFNIVRKFFLMEAGNIMHTFSCLVFDKMMSGTVWLEKSFLNSILEESLQGYYGHVEDTLYIEVDQSMAAVVSLDALAGFTLQYKVDWPIDIMFPQILINTYNQIFTFLLQVKLAKWCLIKINIGKYRSNCHQGFSSKLHRLFLLKAKLLHFVNSLNHYLLTRILHSSGIEFQENISNASDLDTIIQLHTEYVNQIHDRCLLNKKAQLVKEAIIRTLKLTITLYSLCTKGTEYFSWQNGDRIEAEFTRCIHFLMSCLNKHVKRGSFPHLETLSFSLSSLMSGPRYFGITL